jgi:hypothetical protein
VAELGVCERFACRVLGQPRTTQRNTLVQTAKLNDVNPEACIRDILAKIADGHPIIKIDALLPWQAKSSS